MTQLSRWLRTPRGLLLLFGTIVVLPAATLVYLGLRLLEQDGALAAQHRSEVLEAACDRAVSALDAHLAVLTRNLSDPSWQPLSAPPGTTYVLVSGDETTTVPPRALAYYPRVTSRPQGNARALRDVDAAEFVEKDLSRALDASRRQARTKDPGVRAEAMQREATILVKMGRRDAAIAAYRRLATSSSASINGEPADLFARRALCLLLKQASQTAELSREADSLAEDLDGGRWHLDADTYEYVSTLVNEWSPRRRLPRGDRDAFAGAVMWLWHRSAATPATSPADPARGGEFVPRSGVRSLEVEHRDITIAWASAPGRVAAFLSGSAYFRSEWMRIAREAAAPARVSLLMPTAAAPRTAPRYSAYTRRSSADRLPWIVEVSLPADFDAWQLGTRRRLLLSGLAAVLVLVVAGSYLLVRSRQQEIALARLQSDFVAAVSHEFRTPLTSLRQFNELLADGDALPADRLNAYHQAQSRATERLSKLVDSLLDFGRMEAGKRPYRFERLDAGRFVRDLVDDFRCEIDRRGFEVRCHIEPGDTPIEADSEALARAVWNLLDNAVKYSGDGREVAVEVYRRMPRLVSIAVSDKGVGIPKAEQGRIFSKFVRGSAAIDARINGTGIGLAMTEHIVRAHRGRLRLESVETLGSTFTIDVPLHD